MDDKSIKVKCKRCGRMASVGDFILDPVYRLVVCPACVKERKDREMMHKEIVQELHKEEKPVSRPVGWDSEDEYLDRLYKEKARTAPTMEQIDKERVMYKCPKCKHSFVYNIVKKHPNLCTFCGAGITIFNRKQF